MDFVMTQTEHKTFNKKAKLLLLILICDLTRCGCFGYAVGATKRAPSVGMFVDADDGDSLAAFGKHRSTDKPTAYQNDAIYELTSNNYEAMNEDDDNEHSTKSKAEETVLKYQSETINKNNKGKLKSVADDEGVVVNDERKIGKGRGERRRRDSRRLVNDAMIKDDVEQRVVDDVVTMTATEMTAAAILKHKLMFAFAIERKQIPRITFFTCNNNANNNRRNSKQKKRKIRKTDLIRFLYGNRTKAALDYNYIIKENDNNNNNNCNNSIHPIPKDIFIKVVHIDQLSNKNRTGSKTNEQNRSSSNNNNSNIDNIDDSSILNSTATTSDSNWIRAALYAERLRQIVVLELGCGEASRKVIQMASHEGLFSTAYHWILIDEDYVPNRQRAIKGKNNNVDDSRINTNQQNGQRNNIESDGGSKEEERQEEENMDNMEIIGKFLGKINININTELILAKLHLQDFNDEVKNTSLQNKDFFYKLYDVWNPGRLFGGQLNITEIGYFSVAEGLQLLPWYRSSTTITQRVDMKEARIRCLVVITHKNRTDSLEHYLTTRYDTHLDSMHRFNFALLALVRDFYNFSFELSETPSWGYLRNGTFDGMIGALTRNEADIGGSPIFFRLERAKVIDYTTRTWIARPCFIFRHPRSSKSDRIVFLQPFTNDIWILTVVCGIITVLFFFALKIIERRISMAEVRKSNVASPLFVRQKNSRIPTVTVTKTTATSIDAALNLTATASGQNNKKTNGNSEKNDDVAVGVSSEYHDGQSGDDSSWRRVGLLFESLLLYVGLICQQGLAYSTKFLSGRCMITISLFFSFAIYQFYSASIVGTLLMDKPKTIRTLRDLIHSRTLQIGIEDILYNRDFFLRTTDPDALELYVKKVTAVRTISDSTNSSEDHSDRNVIRSESSNWYDPEFGVAKIKEGGFAFHVDVATAYKIISDSFSEKEICDLSEIQLFPPQKMVSIVQKGSPLRKVMTYGLRRATETGLTDYHRKVWHSPKPRCVKKIHTDDLRVDMQTFSSAFLLLIYGFAVSLLTLGFEILHHNLWRYLERAQLKYGVGDQRRTWIHFWKTQHQQK